MAARKSSLAYGLTPNVVVLAVVSLLNDVSSEMILPILPFFLTQVLLANALILGLVEGLSESAVSFTKIFSGWLSDAAGRRRRFVIAGYGLSMAMKVLFPFARSWPEFLGMRVLERTGKGVRDAPRDALLTESAPAETRGKVFGFHRSMDTAGAIAGPLITLFLLATIFASVATADAYRTILLLAAIPTAVSVVLLLVVRETKRAPTMRRPLRMTFRGVPKSLVAFLAIAGAFSLADFSYAFLLLRAEPLVGATGAIGLYVLYNIVYAGNAFPAGILSDRVGRRPVVLIGYVAFASAMSLLILSTSLFVLVGAFILYGISSGMVQGTQRALVADFAPEELKATVLGAYHSLVGVVKIASGLVAGLLWVAIRPEATFTFGALVAAVAAFALFLWRPSR